MKRHISISAAVLFAAGVLAAGAASCSRETVRFGSGPGRGDGEGMPIEFTAYAAGVPTRAVPCGLSDVLGEWDGGSSSFTPGAGVGVFAFYQKAKSNGYPLYYNKNIGEPGFMANQKLERTTSDGISYRFIYSPRKYWPNNVNDMLSFFAYAPYDVSTAWEDLRLESNVKGDRIWRHYELEGRCEDQGDYLWADPAVNRTAPSAGGTLNFSFRHLCSRIGVTCVINKDDDNNFVTIDKVVVRAKFNASGDYVFSFDPDGGIGSSSWEDLERPYRAVDYVQFRKAGGHRLKTQVTRVGADSCFLFPFPGTQDIVVTATFTHNVKVKAGTPEEETRRFSRDISKVFTSMELREGKAFDFLFEVNLTGIDVGTDVGEWSVVTSDEYNIP